MICVYKNFSKSSLENKNQGQYLQIVSLCACKLSDGKNQEISWTFVDLQKLAN